MNVYVVNSTIDGISEFTVYATRDAAYQAAKDIIMGELTGRGFDDPDCPEYYNLFLEVTREFAKGKIIEGICAWNDIADAVGDFENHVFVNVVSTDVIGFAEKERSCKVCGKKNDVGVKVCWCCGNAP